MTKKLYIQGRFITIFGAPVCGAEELPPSDFDFCNPNISESEIRRIFIAKTSADEFTDWSVAAEWMLRLSPVSTDRNAIRELMVIGDKPIPQSQFASLSMQRKRKIRKNHVLNITIDDVSDMNHSFVQQLGLGKTFRVWYETTGGYMYGGNSGIIAYLSADMVLRRGQGEIATYDGTCEWSNLRTEDRVLSPIFNEISDAVCGDFITDLAVSDVTSSSAVISWSGTSPLYQYATTLDPDLPPSTYSLTDETSITITGLTPSTMYHTWVRPVCANGGVGEWQVVMSEPTTEVSEEPPTLPDTDDLFIATMSIYGVEKTGDLVSLWKDFSGMSNDLEKLLTGNAPEFSIDDLNGHPGIKFQEVAETSLETASVCAGLNGFPSCTIFVVAKLPPPPSGEQIVYYGTPGAISTGHFEVYRQPGPYVSALLRGNAGLNNGFMPYAVNQVAVWTFEFDFSKAPAAEVQMFKNNSNVGFSPGGAANNTSNFINGKFGIGRGGMTIGAVLGYSVGMSAARRTVIVDYLKTMFSIP